MMLAIGGQAMALVHPDDAPDFAGCEGSAVVFWEFLNAGCMPTSDEADPPYYYDPEPEFPPTFGSRHWDDPTEDSGWGCSYGSPCWTWSNGVFTILSEDSFNQSIPFRGEKQYLRQYFQVVHTLVPDLQPEDYRWPIGLGLELWDMSVYEEDGWTGCPTGYENLDGDGYLNGAENVPPQIHYPLGGGWYKSIWINDFDDDGSLLTENATEVDLDAATHTACIIGMDFSPEPPFNQTFQIEEIVLDFIWFDDPCGLDIPTTACWRPSQAPAIAYDTNDMPIYEPEDPEEYGPPAAGPTDGQLQVCLNWRPGEDPLFPNDPAHYAPVFNCKVQVDPDPNDLTPHGEFTFPESTDPNGSIDLYFTQANWDVPQNVIVAAVKDTDKEGPEAYAITLTSTIDIADCNFGGPGCEPVFITRKVLVIDNDIPFVSTLPTTPIELSENNPGVVKTMSVRLSHQPADPCGVVVLVSPEGPYSSEDEAETMYMIDPNFLEWAPLRGEPNHMTFTPHTAGTAGQPATWTPANCVVAGGTYSLANMISCWNVPLTISIYAVDNEILGEPWMPNIEGSVIFTPISNDEWYRVPWLELSEARLPVEVEDSGGDAEEASVAVRIEDNECGCLGYDIADVTGGEDGEPDCIVNLADIAVVMGDWLKCTEPHVDGCGKSWEFE